MCLQSRCPAPNIGFRKRMNLLYEEMSAEDIRWNFEKVFSFYPIYYHISSCRYFLTTQASHSKDMVIRFSPMRWKKTLSTFLKGYTLVFPSKEECPCPAQIRNPRNCSSYTIRTFVKPDILCPPPKDFHIKFFYQPFSSNILLVFE